MSDVMTPDPFERHLAVRLEAHVAASDRPFQADSVAAAAKARAGDTRTRWWPMLRLFGPVAGPTSRPVLVALLAALLLLASVGAALVASRLLAPTVPPSTPRGPGAFIGTGAPAEARQGPTLTTLPDGRVALIGGWVSGVEGTQQPIPTTVIEVWDEGSDRFTAVAELAHGRYRHTATLLPDGRVLVIGGQSDPLAPVLEAELWDPVSGTVTPAGSLLQGRHGHTATLLPDGSVLVVGGTNDRDEALPTAEVWDPATGTFLRAGSMTVPRSEHTATLLADGRVAVIGGAAFGGLEMGGDEGRSSTEIWDPESHTFQQGPPLLVNRYGHTATGLPDGMVLLVGGGTRYLFEEGITSTELWSSDHGSLLTGAPAMGRFGHTATLLADGRVLVVGGYQGVADGGGASAELWDPDTGLFSAAGTPAHGFAMHAAALLPDGAVLIAGSYVATRTRLCFGKDVSLVSPPARCTVFSTRLNYGPAAERFDPNGGE